MSALDPLKNFLFRCRHLFRGAPIQVHGETFRVDESLRRWKVTGEDWVLETMRTRLRPGDDVIDVGANFGLHTIYLASRVAPTGRIVAFEPVPANLALLRRNVALNGMATRTTIVASTVSDSAAARLQFHLTPGGQDQTASLRPGDVAQQAVEVANTRLDAARLPEGFSPRLIKIDVEGAELSVLRSARQTLDRFHPLLLLEVHGFALPNFGDSTAALEQFLTDAGYREVGRHAVESGRADYFHLLCQHQEDKSTPHP